MSQACKAEPEDEFTRRVKRKRVQVSVECQGTKKSRGLELLQVQLYKILTAPRGQDWFTPRNLAAALKRTGEPQNQFLSFKEFDTSESDRERARIIEFQNSACSPDYEWLEEDCSSAEEETELYGGLTEADLDWLPTFVTGFSTPTTIIDLTGDSNSESYIIE